MSFLRNAEDIITDALFRSAEPIDGTSDYSVELGLDSDGTGDVSIVETWLNRVYRAIYMGGSELDPKINEDWYWMRGEHNVVLSPVYDTGTVSVTKNNETFFFSTSPTDVDSADESKQDWYLRVDGKPDIYKIKAHTVTATQGTLDSVYTDDTNTAAAFKVFKRDYLLLGSAAVGKTNLLGDVMRLIGPMRDFRHKSPIYSISDEIMERDYPLGNISFGSPTRFAVIGYLPEEADTDTNLSLSVRFNKGGSSTDELIRIDYSYFKRPTPLQNNADHKTVLPRDYTYILSDFLRALILEDKEDSRTGDAYLQAQAGLHAMARDNRSRMAKSGNPGAIYTRQSEVSRRSQGPLRTETGLIIG